MCACTGAQWTFLFTRQTILYEGMSHNVSYYLLGIYMSFAVLKLSIYLPVCTWGQ